jgi:deoxyribonuclease IV
MGNIQFGTVGSPMSTQKKPGGSIGAIMKISELGLNALELGWVQSVRVSEETCAQIKSVSEEYNVKISVHAPYFINLNADEQEWPKSRKRLMDAAYYGNLAGATDIVFHPGSYFGQPADVVLPFIIDRLWDCVRELRLNGNPVILRPETMGKMAAIGSLTDTLAMSQAIDGVLPCLDFAHLHSRTGNGSMNSLEEWSNAMDEYEDHLGLTSLSHLHIHLSGIEYTSKGEKKHLPLQESDINLTALFCALRKHNVTGRILCESPLLEDDALYMQKLWHEM